MENTNPGYFVCEVNIQLSPCQISWGQQALTLFFSVEQYNVTFMILGCGA